MNRNNLIFEPLKEEYKHFFNQMEALVEFIDSELEEDITEDTRNEYLKLKTKFKKQAEEYNNKFKKCK